MELFGTTGQQRRAWLDDTLNNALREYLGPTGLPERLNALNELFNPVVGIEQASGATRNALDPSLSGPERALEAGRAGLEVLGVVAPAAGVAYANRLGAATGDDFARAVEDVYTGFSYGPGGEFMASEYGGAGPARVQSSDIVNSQGFYSPSRLAAENLKQGKGTYGEMRKALMATGAKDDELIWSGFDARFGNRTDKITREEVQDYLRYNTDILDNRQYTAEGVTGEIGDMDAYDLNERYIESNLENETDYYLNDVFPEWLAGGDATPIRDLSNDELLNLSEATGISVEKIKESYKDGYIYDRSWPRDWDDVELYPDEESAIDGVWGGRDGAEEYAREGLESQVRDMGYEELYEALGIEPSSAGDTEYADYFTRGGRDYQENIILFDDPAGLDIRQPSDPHWNEDTTAVSHYRNAFFPRMDNEYGTYHLGEVQSDWGQGIRGRDVMPASDEVALGTASGTIRSALSAATDTVRGLAESGNRINLDHRAVNRMDGVNPDGESLVEYLRVNRSPTDGTLPLDYGPMQSAADDYWDVWGAPYDEALDVRARADTTDPIGPYVGKTEKWVDMTLRHAIVDAVHSGADEMTLGTGKMAKEMTGGNVDGQSEFYDNILPRRMQKVLRKIDPKAELKPTTVETADGKETVLGFRLSPEFKEKVKRDGLPYWMMVPGALGLAAMQDEEFDALNGL